nr:UPF0235 protein C15orf40 homolog isoform X2 [Ovis aries]
MRLLGYGLRLLEAGSGSRPVTRLPLGADMPKKGGATNKGKNQSKEPERPLPPLGPVTVDPKGGVSIAIHAKPGSKQNAVTDNTWISKILKCEKLHHKISDRIGEGLFYCLIPMDRGHVYSGEMIERGNARGTPNVGLAQAHLQTALNIYSQK